MSTAEPLGPSASLTPKSLTPLIVVSALIALVWLTLLSMLGPTGYLAWATTQIARVEALKLSHKLLQLPCHSRVVPRLRHAACCLSLYIKPL
jgi:hypothetical protein